MNTLQNLIETMTKLIVEHEKLLASTSDKTVVIKASNMDELPKLLMLERKQIQSITKIENKREELVDKYFYEQQLPSQNKTVGILLNSMNDLSIKRTLEEQANRLMEVIIEIKQVEELNHALIEQSMVFVELSLDMLQPSIKNMNYHEINARTGAKGNVASRTSMFDSKA